ncbi:MAG: GGDEF domain-containing protein [bacterium]
MTIPDDEFGPLLSVAVATLDRSGTLLKANEGFLRLTQPVCGGIGTDAAGLFVQPRLSTILSGSADSSGLLYSGLMTLGDPGGKLRTLRGRVWCVPTGIRIVAEHDVVELERISETMESLHKESLQSRRALGVANVTLQQGQAQLTQTALTDPLTRVGNRRLFDQALEIEIARVQREGSALSAMMSDVDHFKAVNDHYGHPVGDLVLVRVAEVLKLETRPADVVARFGGEEFVVLMPLTDLRAAETVAERIRQRLANEVIPPLAEPVTSSIGIAQYRPGEDAAVLLGRMDAALYRAKTQGRNRVESEN